MVVLRGEFPSNVYPWLALESRGVEIRWARLDRGFLAPEELRERIDSRTRLVAATFVDWQFGTRNDLGRLASVCRERDVLFCVDGIQGVGALRIDVENAGVDALSCGGHKWLLAPEGCGFLYVSRRVLERIRPVLLGWKSVRDADTYLPYHFELRDDAAKFEPGSPPHLGIHALGGGVELLLEAGADFVETRILELTDLLVEGLRQRGLRVLSPRGPSLSSGIVTFEPGDDPVRLCEELERRGYIVRPRAGGVRVSPHFYNDEDDIGGFLAALDEVRRR
ncbi:MAG: hypothetical protein KatS3mg076_2596 [Candidatus Binatia bacterium]|nr:MAG: hypothetical protein KatS3mg076_2596 [Candidatus Binatia bacterium]